MKSLLRLIPPVHELQRHERFLQLLATYSIPVEEGTTILKEVLATIRTLILAEKWRGSAPDTVDFLQELFYQTEDKLKSTFSYTLTPVINATGTILHTNLGRARLSESAIQHVVKVAQNYSNLEYNIEEGERGSRHVHVEQLVTRLTGAEAAMVVNNNAAAVYLILRALANRKKVIVSRGQLVEIGGSFRISSIMEESGARLVEVGTTNKTHRFDYEQAMDEETAILMKVHTSNFKVVGFTETVETEELVELAGQHPHVLVYEDLGSGALFDYEKYGIGEEPVVRKVLEKGTDLVSFSGDKLLGGPQAGIIAGRKDLIAKLKKHQLARVLRVDKMTLAALEGTLLEYAKGERAVKKIPVVRDLLEPIDHLLERGHTFVDWLLANDETMNWNALVKEATSQVGGGTMPEVTLPTAVVVLTHRHLNAESIARKLRTEQQPPIIVRIQKEEVWIDLRTVTTSEETAIQRALQNIQL